MSEPRREKRPERIGIYGTSSRFVPLREDMRTSAAFLCLKPLAQIILIDFLSHYHRASNFDTSPTAQSTPILYTFGMCGCNVSKNSFYASMRSLQYNGFLQPHWTHKRRLGQAQRWLPNVTWKAYRPDQAQLRILNDYNDRRQQSIDDPNQMKIPFVADLHALNDRSQAPDSDIPAIAESLPKQVRTFQLFTNTKDPG